MRLTTLSDNTLLVEQHMQSSRKILRESCDGLTLEQRRIVESVYSELRPLIEASLTADQIKGIFQQIEKQSVEGGQNRTAIGAGADAVKKANEIINKLGAKLQDTAPVKAFDQKFEQLKAKVAEKFPDLAKQTAGLGEWVKANPGKSAAVIGVLTAIASLAGGPVGGAIAGQVLKGAQELLKGEKLSTAIGKGLKAAAVGWLAGKSMEAVGELISDVYQKFNPIPLDASQKFYSVNVGNGLPSTFQDATFYGSKEQYGQFKGLWGDAVKQWQSGDYEGARAAFDQAREFAQQASDATLNQIALNGDPAEKLRTLNQALTGLAAAAQGAATGATAYDKQGNPVGAEPAKESYYRQTRPLSEGQVYMVFNRVITEAGMLDKLKAGAGKVAGAVSQGASWVGKQATEKVTSAKLLAAWKLEGSPTDSEELKKFLQNYGGITPEVIDKVYTDMKISSAPAAEKPKEQGAASYAEVKKLILALDKKGRQRMIPFIKKQLGTA